MLDDAIEQGLGAAVKDYDSRFPPEWRLSKKQRPNRKKKKGE
ncbi:enoyl-CoA hydratase domain protein [Mycobacterium kansasii]|nr:enoyl-CoA hydratase domain protein [Mycobacterium kansasii]